MRMHTSLEKLFQSLELAFPELITTHLKFKKNKR